MGLKESFDWYQAAIAERYKISVGPRLGSASDYAKEARALNRVVRCLTMNSLEYETDPRRVAKLSAECGFETAEPCNDIRSQDFLRGDFRRH